MSGGLAEIRGWLVKGESEEAWLGICRSLEGLEVSEREMCVSYVAQYMKGWGESLRRPLYGWWEKYRRGEVTGFEGLVLDWSRYAWEEGKVAGEARGVASLAGMRMRWIPAGTFWMGAGDDDEEATPWDEPRRKVTLTRGYWMMETPVTQRQYLAVVGENPSEFKKWGLLDAPVEQVSWYDAAAFANKLSALEGVSESFVGSGEDMDGVGNKGSDYVESKGWRLPTEAEWEYACRAGTTTPRYGDLESIAWCEDNSLGMTHDVGQKQANPWGVHDMLGNVFEWCYDMWEDRTETERRYVDPVGLAATSLRAHRGGSWDFDAPYVRAAYCGFDKPRYRKNNLGFRLVRLGA